MSRTVYDDKTVTEHAADAAEAVRAINHLTMSTGCVEYASEIFRVTETLGLMAQRLPQAFRQLDRIVGSWTDAGRLTVSGRYARSNPHQTRERVSAALTGHAVTAAQILAQYLAEAADALAYADLTANDNDDLDDSAGAESGA